VKKTVVKKNWYVKDVNGEFEVYQGSRRKRTWPSAETALRWVRQKALPGERIYMVEPDGYRVDISRRSVSRYSR
jgi:hypothetical protein